MKLERSIICGFVLLLMLSLIPVASAKAPFADFTGVPTYGTPPLTVQFTDQSTGIPTGWAWYFGDETYNIPWTQMTAGAGWSARLAHSSVVMPDGNIILMGGADGNNIMKNDVWRSIDNGATWTLINASAGWSARAAHSTAVMPDGSIVLMGGYTGQTDSDNINDVWRSSDQGATWTRVTANAGWTPRGSMGITVTQDGSIIVTGGSLWGGYTQFNDIWQSTDKGVTWTRMTASAEWSPRYAHSTVVMPNGSIILTGGYTFGPGYWNDTWRSTDNGATWTLVNGSSGWVSRFHHTTVALPDGSIVLIGGGVGNTVFFNDVWRSTDNGDKWTQVTASTDWKARDLYPSVVMPDGSIVLMGGRTEGNVFTNDVWRYQPAGSSLKNPSHTYTTPGIYSVALQVFNSDGYTRTIKKDYIRVLESDYIITLKPGWNFISTPKMLETGYDTASIFKNVDTDGHSIWLYNAQVKQWTAMGASSKINPLDGIWVYSTQLIDIPLRFDKNPLNAPPTKQVYAGWNSIGFSDIYPVSAKSTLSSVKNGWSTVIGYDADNQGYEVSIINGDTGIHTDSREMIPTKGYWLGMMENGTLLAIGA